jgi:hypothetical protein
VAPPRMQPLATAALRRLYDNSNYSYVNIDDCWSYVKRGKKIWLHYFCCGKFGMGQCSSSLISSTVYPYSL